MMTANIQSKIKQIQDDFDKALILNPTENIPWKTKYNFDFLEGLYIPEDARGKDSRVCFAGRAQMQKVMTDLYSEWTEKLTAKTSSFKLYSGLHAHIILFMSIGKIGDKVLLLPESAGGHYATTTILKRLGFQIKHCIIDEENFCVNPERTMDLIDNWEPNFIFIDRSDGLYYEDFSWLSKYSNIYKIFDASQYLAHILAQDYINPFKMGMNLILASTHKNYPGPQKAAFFSKEIDEMWKRIENGVSLYVSNSHPLDIFKTVSSLPETETIKKYSITMLKNTRALENTLIKNNVPIVKRSTGQTMTQQIWLPISDKESGYDFFKRLEKMQVLTNYRTLPYELGYGLRIGTSAATRQGLTPKNAVYVGELIAKAFYSKKLTKELVEKSKILIQAIKNN